MRSLKGNWVYVFLTLAIILIMAKYISIPIDSSKLIIDLLAFLSILIAVFIIYNYFLQTDDEFQSHIKEVSKLKDDIEISKKKITEMIDAAENRSSEEKKDIVKVGIVSTEIKKLTSLKDLNKRADKILSILASQFQINSGILYKLTANTDTYNAIGTFAIKAADVVPIEVGVGLHGQAISGNETRVIDSIPENYYSVYSGLGESKPTYLYFLPVFIGENVIGLLELSSFKRLKIDVLWSELNLVIGNVLMKD